MPEGPYIGRFAPSPTGDLHFGSVVTAVAGFLQARHHGGLWHLRIDDLDPPRTVPGAADAIRRTLERFGLEWDGEVIYQSQRTEVYRAALARLEAQSLLYPCTCSRRSLAPGPYPGHCARRSGLPGSPSAWRVRVGKTEVPFGDPLQGPQHWNLADLCGDFVVWRVDDLASYHLAAVVDDAALNVTEIVRGADLLDSAPRQIFLQRALAVPTPGYVHLPIAVSAFGRKLSKQTFAQTVAAREPGEVIRTALRWLGQPMPDDAATAPPSALLAAAVPRWSLADVPHQSSLPAPPGWD
jgi:glutamyl-Q tRNA(Asp) synthetase